MKFSLPPHVDQIGDKFTPYSIDMTGRHGKCEFAS